MYIVSMEATNMTQQAKFEAAQAAVKAFMVKHGNVALLGETKKAVKVKEHFYQLQDAAADAYWTDEMESAMRGAL
jgi:hypothetical protein